MNLTQLYTQTEFKGLPDIPEEKTHGVKGRTLNCTFEKVCVRKIENGKKLSKEAEEQLSKCFKFYNKLIQKLDGFNFKDLNHDDLKNLKNYLLCAFDLSADASFDREIPRMYRVIINKNVTGDKDTITEKKWLTNPPKNIIQDKNKYGRANTPNYTVFYGSESIDTAINELQPKEGDIITIGCWDFNSDNKLTCFPISHNSPALGINETSTTVTVVFEELKKVNLRLYQHMEPFFTLLGKQFSKHISHHYEYFVSSLFADEILNTKARADCLIYPSVQNKFKTNNWAINDEAFKDNFVLNKAIEIEVTKTYYDQEIPQNTALEDITIIEYKNYKTTTNIKDNTLIWS